MTRKLVSILLTLFIFGILAQLSSVEGSELSSDVSSRASALKDDAGEKVPSAGKERAPVKISVFVSVVCEDNAELEEKIKAAAENKLRLMGGFEPTDTMEDASVLLSFVGFRMASGGEKPGRVVYSFAYGTPDLAFVDSKVIAIPRYIYHEPVMVLESKLRHRIGVNIEMANRDFMEPLRQ